MTFSITVSPKFKKVMQKKPAPMQAAIAECITRLAENPRHPGLNTHPMRGVADVFEAYVDKGNRLTFQYDESGGILLRNNCNHDMLYRNP